MNVSAATRARLLALGPIEPDQPSLLDWRTSVRIEPHDEPLHYWLLDGLFVMNEQRRNRAVELGLGDRITEYRGHWFR